MRLEDYLLTEAASEASNRTRLQESLHCVGFSIAQKTGDLTNESLADKKLFVSAYLDSCDVDASYDELYDFLMNNKKWGVSVVTAVNATRKSKWYKKSNYKFYRGTGFMNLVYTEFGKLKKMDGIKLNNDKWNPGDIWASTTNNLPTFNSLIELNDFISTNLENGVILPISLKMVKGAAKVVFQGPSEPLDEIGYKNVVKPKDLLPTGINVESTQSGTRINFRSFRISKGADITGEIIKKGTGARHGKVGSKDLKGTIKEYNIPQMTKKRISSLSDEELIQHVGNLWGQCGHSVSKKDMEKSWKKRQNSIQDRVGYWQSIIHALELGAFLNTHKSIANGIMNNFYISASSITEFSSNFIKVY
jgi:hypothetical protein